MAKCTTLPLLLDLVKKKKKFLKGGINASGTPVNHPTDSGKWCQGVFRASRRPPHGKKHDRVGVSPARSFHTNATPMTREEAYELLCFLPPLGSCAVSASHYCLPQRG